MPFSIEHPAWIAVGIVLVLIGIWLVRWAARNNMAGAISGATAEMAINKLRKGGKLEIPSHVKATMDDVSSAPTAGGKAQKIAVYAARNAMSQLAGSIGFILIIAGLMAAVLGVYYG